MWILTSCSAHWRDGSAPSSSSIPLSSFPATGLKRPLAHRGIGQLGDRPPRGDDLDHLVAERRPDRPAEGVVVAGGLDRLSSRHAVIGLVHVGADREDPAIGLLVEHIEIRVNLRRDADR
jgi:hypothetical protein